MFTTAWVTLNLDFVCHSCRNHPWLFVAECGKYVCQFRLPKFAPHLGHLFTDEKNKNNYSKKSFSCTGSEFLTLAPLLRRYFENNVRPRGEHVDKVDCMLAASSVVMLLTSVKTGTVTPEKRDEAVLYHLALFLVAWGGTYVRPKHHYCIHLGPMLAQFGSLFIKFHTRKEASPSYSILPRQEELFKLGYVGYRGDKLPPSVADGFAICASV